MALAIGDVAPDFEAETTQGRIRLHDWIGDAWCVLFSHPKDFTPVCTTELGYMAKIKPEFDRRNVKIIGLSVDPVGNHARWADDIRETQGHAPNYPMIGDPDLGISKLYGMLPAATAGTSEGRTPADNQTVRNVFVIGPDKKIKLILVYPDDDGAQLRRGPARDRFAADDGETPRGDAGQLETGRRRHHRRLGDRRRGAAAVSARLAGAEAVYPHRAAARPSDVRPRHGRNLRDGGTAERGSTPPAGTRRDEIPRRAIRPGGLGETIARRLQTKNMIVRETGCRFRPSCSGSER